jgi:hypothetical protein
MNQRPINRKLLAAFIEYAATGVVTQLEWKRFAVNHYQDPVMEKARANCVRFFHNHSGTDKLSSDDRDFLRVLAKELRDAT